MKDKFIKKLVLFAAFIAFAGTLIACNGGSVLNTNEPNDDIDRELSARIENVAEAFYESGITFDEETPIEFSEIESFLYYLYNDELTASENGYALLSETDADRTCIEIFSVAPKLRYRFDFEDDVLFYYKNKNYFIKPNESAAKSIDVKSVLEEDEDGRFTATVDIEGADGSMVAFQISFSDGENNIRVFECVRFEYN